MRTVEEIESDLETVKANIAAFEDAAMPQSRMGIRGAHYGIQKARLEKELAEAKKVPELDEPQQ